MVWAEGGNLSFWVEGGFDGSIDNVSVRLSSTSANIPADDTKPQSSEGTKCLQLKHIPSNANNIIHIRGHVLVSHATFGVEVTAALFVDAGVDAVASGIAAVDMNNGFASIPINYKMKAGGTSEKTFYVNVGAASGSVAVDGTTVSWRHGGTWISTLELIEEYV